MKVILLEKHPGSPLNHRDVPVPWLVKARAALHLEHQYATLFVRTDSLIHLENGWGTNNNNISGWHFHNELLDEAPETLCYRHLLDFEEGEAITYFFDLIFGDEHFTFSMLQIAKAVRDCIEIDG